MSSVHSIAMGGTGAAGEAGAAGDAAPGPDSPPFPKNGPRQAVEIRRDATVRPAIDLDWLRESLRSASLLVGRPCRHINVRIVDDAAMQTLHKLHCGLDETTDVLTFPFIDAEVPGIPGSPIEVDIAVCADEAARRSAELGHSIERELLLYCVHGLLHCAGFDDHDEADYDAMHAEEDRILEAIGVGKTFAARADDSEAGERR